MAVIGQGHAAAMWRLGLAELRNAFNPAVGSVADKEVGLYGTLTQGEIADARQGDGPGREPESYQGLRSAAQAAAKEDARDRDGDEPSREMER